MNCVEGSSSLWEQEEKKNEKKKKSTKWRYKERRVQKEGEYDIEVRNGKWDQ